MKSFFVVTLIFTSLFAFSMDKESRATVSAGKSSQEPEEEMFPAITLGRESIIRSHHKQAHTVKWFEGVELTQEQIELVALARRDSGSSDSPRFNEGSDLWAKLDELYTNLGS
jgi:hypothetical protein